LRDLFYRCKRFHRIYKSLLKHLFLS